MQAQSLLSCWQSCQCRPSSRGVPQGGRGAAALCSGRGQQPAFGLSPLLRQCVLPAVVLKLKRKSDFPELEPFLHKQSALLSENGPHAALQKERLKTAEHRDHCFAPPSRLCGYQVPPVPCSYMGDPQEPARSRPHIPHEAPRTGLGNQGAEGPHRTPLQPLSPHAELLS